MVTEKQTYKLIKLKERLFNDLIVQLREKTVSNYYDFFVTFWDIVNPDKYVDNWHIKKIADELQEAGERLAKKEKKAFDIIINMPPGESKSTLVTIMFPVWLWLKNPSLSIISSSYSGGLSTEHSRKSKDIVRSDLFKLLYTDYFIEKFGERLIIKKDNEGYWDNNFGGFRSSTSTGGSATGRHADLIIRDDPINPEQAESKAYRERALRFNGKTLSRRKRNNEVTLTITVMQRLHKDDQTGHDLKVMPTEIKHFCLPAELTKGIRPKEWRKYYKDGLLDANRLSKSELSKAKKQLGSIGYAGQMLQDPIVKGGNILKKKWFGVIEAAPVDIVWDMFIDGAYTKNKDNDPTGFLLAGEDIVNRRLVIRYFGSEYLELPSLLKQIPKTLKRHGGSDASRIYVEPKASGLSIIQMVTNLTYLNIIPIKNKLVQASKIERANYAAPFAEAGRIVLVRGGWNEDFLLEATTFPNAEHDESIDLLAYACRKYLHNG